MRVKICGRLSGVAGDGARQLRIHQKSAACRVEWLFSISSVSESWLCTFVPADSLHSEKGWSKKKCRTYFNGSAARSQIGFKLQVILKNLRDRLCERHCPYFSPFAIQSDGCAMMLVNLKITNSQIGDLRYTGGRFIQQC